MICHERRKGVLKVIPVERTPFCNSAALYRYIHNLGTFQNNLTNILLTNYLDTCRDFGTWNCSCNLHYFLS
jgi:hypothetical protein